jgi:hypothetical protein
MAQLEDKLLEAIKAFFEDVVPTQLTVSKVRKLASGGSYYLVSFRDAGSGRHMAATIGEQDLKVAQSAETDGKIEVAEPEKIKQLSKNGNTKIELVWQPSRLSFSPFYPFWKVHLPGASFYVDQQGNEFNDLETGQGG